MNDMLDSKPKNKDKRLSADDNRPMIHTESLMEIFGFDENALRTNERGFVTNRQKQQIADALKGEADSMWLMVNIFLGTAAVLAVIFALQGYAPLPLVIGSGIVIGTLLLLAYNRQSRFKQDVNRLRTFRVEGMPMVRATVAGDQQAQLRIGDQTLPISYQQAAALSEFALPMMRVYYAANSKQVLSAEVLDMPEIEKLKNEELIDADDEYDLVVERQLDEHNNTSMKS